MIAVAGNGKRIFSSLYFNWISGGAPEQEIRCKVKTRYRQKEQSACVIPVDDRKVDIIFDQPQRAITRGQAAVLYDGEVVLGGGTITRIF